MTVRRYTRSVRWALPVLAGLAFTGCDLLTGSEESEGTSGEFRVTVTGEIELSTEGSAAQGSWRTDEGEERWGVVMTTDQDEAPALSLSIIRVGERPDPDVYLIVDPETELPGGFYAALQITEGSGTLYAQGVAGTVQINSSSNGRVTGLFQFSGTGYRTNTGDTLYEVTVEGEFDTNGELDDG